MKPHKIEGFQKKGRKTIVKCQTILLADSPEAAILKLKGMNRRQIRDLNFNISYKLRAFEVDEDGERVKTKAVEASDEKTLKAEKIKRAKNDLNKKASEAVKIVKAKIAEDKKTAEPEKTTKEIKVPAKRGPKPKVKLE